MLTSLTLIPRKYKPWTLLTEANTVSHSSIPSISRSNPVLPFCLLEYTGQNHQTQCLKSGTKMPLSSDVAEWEHPRFNDIRRQFHNCITFGLSVFPYEQHFPVYVTHLDIQQWQLLSKWKIYQRGRESRHHFKSKLAYAILRSILKLIL